MSLYNRLYMHIGEGRINHSQVQLGLFSMIFSALLFFPSITFGITTAEVFPYALIMVLFLLKRVSYSLTVFLFFLFMHMVMGFFFNYESGFRYLYEITRSLMAYLNPLLVFVLILGFSNRAIYKIEKIALYVFFLIASIGLIQNFVGVDFFNPIIKYLVPRAALQEVGVRGVTLLSTEPARGGVEFLFIYILVRVVYIKRNKWLLTDLAIGLFFIVVIKSAVVLAVYLIFILVFYRKFSIVLMSLFVFIVWPLISNLEGRSVLLIKEVGSLDFNDALFYLMNTSGNRIISIWASFIYGFHHPLGGGIGNWVKTSMEAVNLTGVDLMRLNYFTIDGRNGYMPFRTSGYMFNLMMDTGIIGFLFFSVFMLSVLKKYWKLSALSKSIIILFVINILFIGSVGTPVVWVTTAILLRHLYINSRVLLCDVDYIGSQSYLRADFPLNTAKVSKA